MKMIKSTLSCLALLSVVLYACDDDDTDSGEIGASADIAGLNGNTVSGSAEFVQVGGEVEMVLTLEGLTPGNHAVHLHTGTCGDTTTIGDHWNPTSEPHGQRGSGQFHRGDVGNVEADEDGNATLTLSAEDWTVGGGGEEDVIGKLVIVHAGADDYVSQPSGNSGDMIGCGTIQ